MVFNGGICCALNICVSLASFLVHSCSLIYFENSFSSIEKNPYFESKSSKEYPHISCSSIWSAAFASKDILHSYGRHQYELKGCHKKETRLATTSGTWPQLDFKTIPPFRWRTARPYIGLPPVGFVPHTNGMQPRRIQSISRNYIATRFFLLRWVKSLSDSDPGHPIEPTKQLSYCRQTWFESVLICAVLLYEPYHCVKNGIFGTGPYHMISFPFLSDPKWCMYKPFVTKLENFKSRTKIFLSGKNHNNDIWNHVLDQLVYLFQ